VALKELKENPAIQLTAVGIYHVPGTKLFVAFKLKTKGSTVESIQVEHEPDLKPITIDNLKVSVVHEFMSEELTE
jgi:hypothetical protein